MEKDPENNKEQWPDQEPESFFGDIPHESSIDIDIIEVMIVVERPSKEELGHYNRAEKYKILRSNHVHHQQEITSWIKINGFEETIKIIDQPTAFNILFAKLPAELIASLQEAPGIIEVNQVDEFGVDLLNHQNQMPQMNKNHKRNHSSRHNRIY
ncbi:MAG: hypothetical protein AAGD96_10785 [Chloroflexota bacterium]